MSKSIYLSSSTQEKNIGYGDYGTEEQRMFQLGNEMKSILESYDIKVYRDKKEMTLKQIVSDSNSKKPNIHFALHSNAYNKKSRGCEVFCYKFNSTGHNLAKIIYKLLSSITPTSDRGVKQGYNFYGTGKHIYEVAYTTAPAALAEIAFHDNPEDAKWIIDNISLIAFTLSKAVLEFFKIDIKPVELYHVQVGAFSLIQNAEKLKEQLKEKGFESFIRKEKI